MHRTFRVDGEGEGEVAVLWRLRSILRRKNVGGHVVYPWSLPAPLPFTLYAEISSFLLFSSITFFFTIILFLVFLCSMEGCARCFTTSEISALSFVVVPFSKIHSSQELESEQITSWICISFYFLVGKSREEELWRGWSLSRVLIIYYGNQRLIF